MTSQPDCKLSYWITSHSPPDMYTWTQLLRFSIRKPDVFLQMTFYSRAACQETGLLAEVNLASWLGLNTVISTCKILACTTRGLSALSGCFLSPQTPAIRPRTRKHCLQNLWEYRAITRPVSYTIPRSLVCPAAHNHLVSESRHPGEICTQLYLKLRVDCNNLHGNANMLIFCLAWQMV